MSFAEVLKPKEKKWYFLNTLFWGFLLWLFGYILGFIFFAFVPKDSIGFFVMPFGIAATLLVLFKVIERKKFQCYVTLGIFWAIIAVFMDYTFIVKLLNSAAYYKPDVYIYYLLTFSLPVLVGLYKFRKS